MVGQCASERKPITLANLPPDYLRMTSGLGGAAPAHARAWPLMSQDTLLGVLEIASFRAFNSTERALLEELLPVVAMSLEILQRNLHTRQLLDQIRTSEERSRLILESSAEGIFGTDTEGRITFVNPAACRMLGFTAEELIGQPSHASSTTTGPTAAITRRKNVPCSPPTSTARPAGLITSSCGAKTAPGCRSNMGPRRCARTARSWAR